MTDLKTTAPAFVETAHRIVWATVATVDKQNNPRTRVLHPIWEWDGDQLTGWIATTAQSPKASDLAHNNAEAFGVIELTPRRLRVFPGSLLLTGQGELLTWTAHA